MDPAPRPTTPNGDAKNNEAEKGSPSDTANQDSQRGIAPTVSTETVTSTNGMTQERGPQKDKPIPNDPHDRYDWDLRYHANEAHDRTEREVEFLERISQRDVRRRQHNRYMLLLDDRMERVEEDLRLLLGRPDLDELKSKAAKTSEDSEQQRHCITEAKLMSWKEYSNTNGDSDTTHEPQCAIDMLGEEPIMYQPELRWYNLLNHVIDDVATTSESLKTADGAPSRGGSSQTKVMPERIRINCPKLCDALREFAPDGTLSHPDVERIIFRKPFKFLFHNEQLLRNFTSEKERALSRNIVPPDDSPVNQENTTPPTGEQTSENEATTNGLQIANLKLLLKVISEYIMPEKERAMERVCKRERISFHDLHFLFNPGDIVYVRHKEQSQKTWRVIQVTGGNRYLRKQDAIDEEENDYKSDKRDSFSSFVLDCYFLAFDGIRFRRVFERFSIPFFSDEQSTKRFWILPLQIAKDKDLLKENLILDQGCQYLECTKISHRYYHGRTLDRDPQGARLRARGESEGHPGVDLQVFSESIDGNVMIDFDKAYQQNQDWVLDFDELSEYKVNPREWESYHDPQKETIQGDFIIDSRRKEAYLDEQEGAERLENWETKNLRNEDLLVLPDRAPAFVLRSRKWVYIRLGRDSEGQEGLSKVEKRREAWDELQLPGEEHLGPDEENRSSHKYIIQSLVAKHFAKDMNLDLVRNKGRGLIVLLHGAPGVGKTSTAECVAEAAGKPLLPITCGDLGLDPQQVEVNLSKHFELAQSWDCILLLDEADVFLAQRSLRDLNRNALVSVFLRILEYYEGILFLTTNKVGLIDEAFKSRIHMALYYPWLTEEQTISIWRSLLKKAGDSQQGLIFDRTDIIKYARNLFHAQTHAEYGKGPDGVAPGWNGRQIKNGFMSAIALAQYEAKRKGQLEKSETPVQVYLKPEHFDTVVKASNAFDHYLWKVHSYMADAKIAEKGGFRIDGPGFHEPDTGSGIEQLSNTGPYQTKFAQLNQQTFPQQQQGSLQQSHPRYTMPQDSMPYTAQPTKLPYQPTQQQQHQNFDPYSVLGQRQPVQQSYGHQIPQQDYRQDYQQQSQGHPQHQQYEQQPQSQQYQQQQLQGFANQPQHLHRSPQVSQPVADFDSHGQQRQNLNPQYHNANIPNNLPMQAT